MTPPPPPPTVAQVQVTPGAATIDRGGSVALAARAVSATGATLSSAITWSSNAPTVATVDASGRVTGVAAGQATISASAGAVSGSAAITVVVPVAAVTLVGDTAALIPGATRQLSATARDAGGTALPDRTISWSSSAPSVAAVSSQGLVTALAPGQVTISATAENVAGRLTLTVLPPVTTVTITGDTAALLPGATRQLTATPRDAAGAALAGRPVTWSSSAPTVATVSSTGLVTAITPGQVTIAAKSENATGAVPLAVWAPVASIAIVPDSLVLLPADARSFTLIMRDATGATLSGRPVTWTSTAPAIATVNATGLVTTIAPGRALVIAASEGKADSAVVRVVIPESRLVFDRVPSQLRPGFGLGLVVRATRTGLDTVTSFTGPITIQDESGATSLIGTATVAARNGIAVFDELAIGTAGSYRLRASAPLYTAVSSSPIVVTTTPSLPTIAVGTIQRTALTVGVQGSARYRIPVTLRDEANALVAPTRVSVAIARGQGSILSGSTTLTTSNGSATFDLVIQGTAALTLAFSAPGVETKSQDIESPSDYWSTYMALQRLPADSVVPVGRSIALTASLGSSSLASAPAHAVTYELSWNPDQLMLSADTTVANASYSINRAQLGEGVLRVSVSSASPLGAVGVSNLLHRFTLTVRAGASGVQIVRITGIDFRGPSGELLSPRRPFDVSFRVP